jgi:hypothetical protein
MPPTNDQSDDERDVDAEVEPELAADNPLVQELLSSILTTANRIVEKNGSGLTAKQLIAAAKLYLPGQLPKLHRRKKSAWNIALRMEKGNVPEELQHLKPDKRKDGRLAFTGEYQKWMKERWDNDTALREQYKALADARDTSDEDNEEAPDERKALQKKSLNNLKKQVG